MPKLGGIVAAFLFGLIAIPSLTRTYTQTPIPTTYSDQATTEYLNALSGYRDSHDKYLTARKGYLQFGTSKSKSEAETATKAMLLMRSQTVTSYLKLLIVQISPQADYNRAHLTSLNSELDLFEANSANLTPLTSLEELVANSDEFQSHYETQTLKLTELSRSLANFSQLDRYLADLESFLPNLSDEVGKLTDPQKALATTRLNLATESITGASQLLGTAKSLAQNLTIESSDLSGQVTPLLLSAVDKLIQASDHLIDTTNYIPL